jgi:formate hydrogenlyase subunit 6/NADH:ubiquinone oxidoreductase subunit I
MAMEGELLRSLGKKPVTIRYPFERLPPVEALRGKVFIDIEKCTGCTLCVRDCPTFALEIVGKGRTCDMIYYLDRCAFCGQCEESCPSKAVKLTAEYELANDKGEVKIVFKRPKKE